MEKTVHFHIGPHKTGSTAIQDALRTHRHLLETMHGLHPIFDPMVGKIAKALINGRENVATSDLEQLANHCRSQSADCLISCEDLSGDLPGRSNKRRPYPRLWENINFIRKSFPGFRCKFYFFVRNPDDWVRSAYFQILKHRGKFNSLREYQSFLRTEDIWDATLKKTRDKLGSDFIEIPYEEGGGFSSIKALGYAILGEKTNLGLPDEIHRPNRAPYANIVTLLEAVNRSGASREAQSLAKRCLLNGVVCKAVDSKSLDVPAWPPRTDKPDWLSPNLEALWKRAGQRVYHQNQPNLLPDSSCNLSEFRVRVVEASEKFPEGNRASMQNQERILRYRFRGLPETCFLLGMSISYLRRNTDHTRCASFLFQRLWEEEYAVLLGTLPTRWLISTFQTFLDHGINEAQRLIGSSAYFLSNILRAYETERAFDGLQPNRIYPNKIPTAKLGFVGMDRFNLGGTDMLLNTNALLLELSAKDPRAGRVVQEFMLRTKAASSIFSRMDQSRIEHEVDIPQFANCWSFFEPPEG